MTSSSGTESRIDPARPPAANTPRELELLRKSQSGDRAAYGQLVELYQHRLFNAVLRMIGNRDEAAELTQEAFTRGLLKIDSFRGDSSPYTWLFRIAVNLTISQLRKVQRHRTFSLDRPISNGQPDQAAGLHERSSQPGTDPRAVVENREQNAQVLAALGRLDAEYRAVLVMRDVEGFDYQQIADVLSLPLGTLKSRLFRARLALRDELRMYLTGKSQ